MVNLNWKAYSGRELLRIIAIVEQIVKTYEECLWAIQLNRSSHRKCSKTKGVLDNLRENICARVSFLVFSYEFCKTFEKTFFVEHIWTTASVCTLENQVEIELQRFATFALSSTLTSL